MSDEEMARNYALERQKNLHLSQRDTNLIHLAYLHGLKAKLKQLKQQVIHLEQEKCELLGIIQKKDELIQNMRCCENCSKKYSACTREKQVRCRAYKTCDDWELAEYD